MKKFVIAFSVLPLVMGTLALAQLPTVKLPYARPNQPYSVQLSTPVSGTAPFSFNLRPGFGELPGGIRLTTSTGLLSGTPLLQRLSSPAGTGPTRAALINPLQPSARGPQTYHFIVDVTDSKGVLVEALPLELSVSSKPQPMEIGVKAPRSGEGNDTRSPADQKSGSNEKGTDHDPQAADSSVSSKGQSSGADANAKKPQKPAQPDGTSDLGQPELPSNLFAGQKTILVITADPAKSGTDRIKILSVGDSNGKCDPASSTELPLKDGSNTVIYLTANTNGITEVDLAEPLKGGMFICVYRTFTPSAVKQTAQSITNPGSDGQTPQSENQTTPAKGEVTQDKQDTSQETQQTSQSKVQPVLELVPPKFLQDPAAGATTVSVLATPTDAKVTGTAEIELLSLEPDDQSGEKPALTTANCTPDKGVPLTLSGNKLTAPTDNNGIATLTLSAGLVEGDTVCAFQKFTSASGVVVDIANDLPDEILQKSAIAGSKPQEVIDTLDWGRVRAYFAGGALIANNQSSFSSSAASPFLLFNIEKTVVLPGCSSILEPVSDDKGVGGRNPGCASTSANHWPGLTTFFETRLTAIPVQPSSSSTTTSGTQTTSAAAGGNLSSQKTARLDVGAYFPITFTHWYYDKKPNSLFIGPLAKVGFDTLTGSTTQTGTSNTQLNFNRFYNHWGFGARFGHYSLSNASNKSPEVLSYLDVTYGPFSNLQSYVCVPPAAGLTQIAGSDCGIYSATDVDSRTTLNRLDLEGMLKVPKTVMFIGFNANVKAASRKNLDLSLQPNDDLRFLFGVKLDVASVMKKLGISSTVSGQ
jgi:hypothetical protein